MRPRAQDPPPFSFPVPVAFPYPWKRCGNLRRASSCHFFLKGPCVEFACKQGGAMHLASTLSWHHILPQGAGRSRSGLDTANLRTKIVDFRGFDSSIILILRGGIPRPMGSFPESLSQAILAGISLAGRIGRIANLLSLRSAPKLPCCLSLSLKSLSLSIYIYMCIYT